MHIIPADTRLGRWRPNTIGIVCEACGRTWTHRVEDLQRGMPKSTPVDALWDILTAACVRKRGECEAELVSPDDGAGW